MTAARRSVGAQCDGRIYARRTAGRKVTGDERGGGDRDGHGREGAGLGDGHAEQEATKNPARRHGAGETYDKTHRDRSQPLPRDESPDVGTARAERHADTDLSGAPCHRLRQHAVHAKGREEDADERKEDDDFELENGIRSPHSSGWQRSMPSPDEGA